MTYVMLYVRQMNCFVMFIWDIGPVTLHNIRVKGLWLLFTDSVNDKVSLLFFKHFSSFLTVYLLSVVLWLDKGDFHENPHNVYPC